MKKITALIEKFISSQKVAPNPSRRKFMKGAAALAAVAVVQSSGVFRGLLHGEIEEFYRQIESGLVENMTIRISKPIFLSDLQNVIFRNITVIKNPDFVGDSLMVVEGSAINCRFYRIDVISDDSESATGARFL